MRGKWVVPKREGSLSRAVSFLRQREWHLAHSRETPTGARTLLTYGHKGRGRSVLIDALRWVDGTGVCARSLLMESVFSVQLEASQKQGHQCK